ncbi:unnamed protein product [Closterium sp. NIES-53]
MFHDPLSDFLCASRHVISRVLSTLVTHPTAPTLSVSALVTTINAFASSHRLDYASHLASSTARSPSTGGVPVFPLEVLEDRHFELRFLAAAALHLSAMLLAPEGDPHARDILIPRTHAEAVSGPRASYWTAAEEVKMATYRSTGTFVDTIPPPGANVVSGMCWCNPTVCIRLVVCVRACVCAWNGLRQAPREWHDTLCTTLAALDFFLSSADPSLFFHHGLTPFFVLVYVDDLVFATPDRCALASVKEELQRRHTCTDLRELQHYLGLQITKDRVAHTITLAQSHMVEQILTRFRFPFSKVHPTPLAVDHGLTVPPSDEPFESSGPYPELVGCLMYPMTCTHPDLSALLCLGDTDLPTGTLLRGLGTGAVSWRSTWASSVSSSSCEAEVYDVAMAAQELRWLSFLTDLGEKPRSPPILFADNMSAILLCEEPRLVGKVKHIQLYYFLLREL